MIYGMRHNCCLSIDEEWGDHLLNNRQVCYMLDMILRKWNGMITPDSIIKMTMYFVAYQEIGKRFWIFMLREFFEYICVEICCGGSER